MNILLNGVGRIGKIILRIISNSTDLNIVAINELNQSIENIAYLINYDTTYGQFDDKFQPIDGNCIQNSRSKIKILNYADLTQIDYKALNIDVVIDASGAKVDISQLEKLPLQKLFLTYPNKDAHINMILGVNENHFDSLKHKIISTSSCNATALLPALKLIDDNYGIEFGDINTIHPLLNHQKVLDASCIANQNRDVKCNFEFGRGSIGNIIPSGTTTVQACSYILEHINSDILSSNSLRVPTQTVGAINLSVVVKKDITKKQLIELFQMAQQNQKFDIFYNNFDPLVSSDFQSQKYTTIVDHRFTNVIQNKMVKLLIWYDNEYGYGSKVVKMVQNCNF